jgi:membrane protein DedA with SNARE-associated domain
VELVASTEILGLFDAEQVQKWFEWGGYFMLFGLLFACGLGLPLPEDIPLLLGGFFVAQGKFDLTIASILAWLGIIGGDCVLYSLGKRYGMNITKVPFVGKHVTKARIEQAERLFEKWGIWVVAVGRLFAGIRGAMVVAAGAIRYNFVKFVIADGLAALVSGGLWIWLGWWIGKKVGKDPKALMERIKPYQHWILLGMIVIAVLAVAYIVWRSRRHKSIGDVVAEKVEEASVEKPSTSPPAQG